MTSIGLCMIVKDEAGVIERCLGSVAGLIDSWVICDTGSTDRTPEIIRATLSGVPGRLHRRTWVDFGRNRTELMDMARGTADYLLLLDADMTVTYDRSRLNGLKADSYMLRHAEEAEYWIKRLVRGDRAWRYVGATHEYITTDPPDRTEYLDAIVIHHHADGGTRADKFERDLQLLNGELERNPDDPRTVFYLAQTYAGLGQSERAIQYHRRRAQMGGWEEEGFYSQYQIGALYLGLGRLADAIEALISAFSRAPHRAEPLCLLAAVFRERGEHHAARLFTERGLSIEKPGQGLFVERWVYEWGLLFEYSIAAYWTGRPRAALDACDRLLALPNLPEPHRRQTIANREFCVQALPGRRVVTSSSSYARRPEHPRAVRTGTREAYALVLDGGRRLRHRGTEADLAVVRQVFDDHSYALPDLERHRPSPATGPPLIVDCGAHIGASSVWFALHHPGARVIALEPDAENYALLSDNVADLPAVSAVNAAIAPQPGTVPTFDPGRGSWGVRAAADPQLAAGEPTGRVRALTIDEVLSEAAAGAPFILKLDIEGAEGGVFSARWATLARFPIVIVELHDWMLPGAGTSRSFLRWHVAHGRDLVPLGENLFSLVPPTPL